MKGIGKNSAGIPTICERPHLGDLILEKYKNLIMTGHDDLEKFHLIDRLEKPVLGFGVSGSKKNLLDLHKFLSQSQYSFAINTKRGADIWVLPSRGIRNAYIHISRFPNLINFISQYENSISGDLWGLLYGYKLCEVHQFTYDWETWSRKRY